VITTTEFERIPEVGDKVLCKLFDESGYCDDPEVCEVWSVHESVNDDLFLVYVMSLMNNNRSNVMYWNTAKNDWDDDRKGSETDRARLVIDAGENTMHTDGNTAAINQYQGLVDQLADEDAALEKYRAEFAEKLMQEYTEDNHKLSWQVAEWLGEESTLLEGYLFSALTDTDFNVGEIWRDWLTERFDDMASAMSSKEIDEYQQEYF